MIWNLYSIKDKLMNFTGPLIFQDDKCAIREFESKMKQLKEKDYTDCKYFDLYKVGQFDLETGEILPPKTHIPELIREGETIE